MKKQIAILFLTAIIMFMFSLSAGYAAENTSNREEIPEKITEFAKSQLPSFASHYMPPTYDQKTGLDISNVKLGEGYARYYFDSLFTKPKPDKANIDDMISPISYIFQVYSFNDIPIGLLSVNEINGELHASEANYKGPTEIIAIMKKIAEDQLDISLEINDTLKYIRDPSVNFNGIAFESNGTDYFVTKAYEGTEIGEFFDGKNVITADEFYNFAYHHQKVAKERAIYEENGGIAIEYIVASIESEKLAMQNASVDNQFWIFSENMYIYLFILAVIAVIVLTVAMVLRKRKNIAGN